MTDLTAIDAPFGELDRETQIALFSAWLDGGAVQSRGSGYDWAGVSHPAWGPDGIYRLAPPPVTPMTVDPRVWEVLDPSIVAIARDNSGAIYSYASRPVTTRSEWCGSNACPVTQIAPGMIDPGTCPWDEAICERPEASS